LISSVVLNWKRPANVLKIAAGWRDSNLVSDPIVFCNAAGERYRIPPGGVTGCRMIEAREDFGLYTRFAAACLVKCECVLIQDDDLIVPESTLGSLFAAWQAEPERLHGIFGRGPDASGAYARQFRGRHDVPIVLTRALLMRREYAWKFFAAAEHFAAIQRDGRPVGNGEDIILSYAAMAESGKMNRIHDLPIVELPAVDAIHARNWGQHVAHRTRLMRACEHWLKTKRDERK